MPVSQNGKILNGTKKNVQNKKNRRGRSETCCIEMGHKIREQNIMIG